MKKVKYKCVNCQCGLDSRKDFMIYDKGKNVCLCEDCYNIPEWYELINYE